MRLLFSGSLCLAGKLLLAQALITPADPAYSGTLFASVYQADAFSGTFNPAFLSKIKQPAAGIYAEQRFATPGLGVGGAAVVVPFEQIHAGVQVQRSGIAVAGQTHAALDVARSLGKEVTVGLSFRYLAVGASGYRTRSVAGMAAGVMVRVSPHAFAGFSIANPHRGRLGGNGGEQLAARYHLALGGDLSPELALNAAVNKTEGAPFSVTVAAQYRFAGKVFTRIGVDARQFFLGGGFLLGVIRLDVYAVLHPRLGITPGLQISCQPKPAQ